TLSCPRVLEACLGRQAGADVLTGSGCGEALHGLLRFLAQLLRYDDVDGHQQVAGGLGVLDPAALDPQRAAGRRSRGNTDLDRLAVDRWYLNVCAQGRLREGDRNMDAEVVAVAGVEVVALDVDGDH